MLFIIIAESILIYLSNYKVIKYIYKKHALYNLSTSSLFNALYIILFILNWLYIITYALRIHLINLLMRVIIELEQQLRKYQPFFLSSFEGKSCHFGKALMLWSPRCSHWSMTSWFPSSCAWKRVEQSHHIDFNHRSSFYYRNVK